MGIIFFKHCNIFHCFLWCHLSIIVASFKMLCLFSPLRLHCSAILLLGLGGVFLFIVVPGILGVLRMIQVLMSFASLGNFRLISFRILLVLCWLLSLLLCLWLHRRRLSTISQMSPELFSKLSVLLSLYASILHTFFSSVFHVTLSLFSCV